MATERSSNASDNLGSLRCCLDEGDSEQRQRERRIRRRALVASVLLQGTALIALLLIPLFAKPERLVQPLLPVPFYKTAAPRPAHPQPEHPRSTPLRTSCHFCAPTTIPPIIVTHDPTPQQSDPDGVPALSNGPSLPGQIPFSGPPTNVPPPIETHLEKPRVVHVTHIDPAMLVHRVEPVFPVLARQIGRSGRVELRAVIATDGTIQSLQVVSGDPMFYRSALDAVQQWRYKPTILNGQPVEIDTFITVIYNIPR